MSENNQVTDTTSQQDESFDNNWQAFLSHSFGDEDVIEGESTVVAGEGNDSITATSGTDTISGGEGNDAVSAKAEPATGQDNAAAPASDVAPEGTSEKTVPDTLLAEMLNLGGSKPTQDTETRPAAQGGSEAPKDTPSEGDFMPFQPTFKLDPGLTSALFESEDSEQRAQALVSLLSAFGNAVTQTVEMRFREVYQPKMLENFQQTQSYSQVARAVHDDFYGTYPELAAHKSVVQRAMEILSKQEAYKDKPYDKELRDMAANLAKRTLQAAGIQLGQRQPENKPAAIPKTGQRKPQAETPFEAGGARPSGSGESNGPADLVEQLSKWA